MNDITQLVEMALNGDKAAFDSLYERTKGGVWFTCISLLKNEENAKDIMQDTYLAAYEKLGTLENHAAFQTWLNKIAANKCKNFIAAKANSTLANNSEEILKNIPDDKLIPEEYVTDAEKRRIIMDIIEDALSVNQFRTVILYYFDELSIAEIAALMDCHEKTVQYRLKTARVKIKDEITRYEEENRDRLHAVMPLLPLARIFAAQAENVSVPPMPGISISSISSASSDFSGDFSGAPSNALNVPPDQAAAAVKTGGKAMLNSLKAKIIAGACAVVVVGGGVTAGVVIANSSKNKTTTSRPAYSANANTSTNSSKPGTGSFNTSSPSQSKPAASTPAASGETEYPQFEGLTPVKLLRSTGDYREHDPDIISGKIKDAYLYKNGSYVLLTNDGEIILYSIRYGDYAPTSFGKNTGITRLDNMLFRTDNNDSSLLVVDGNNVFFKVVDSEGNVKLSTNTGSERSAQGVLFEGRNMRELRVDSILEVIYAADENGNGFELQNRYMSGYEFTSDKGVYADTSECFFYYPDQANSFIYHGMKVKQRAGRCFIAEDDNKLYYHRAGSSHVSEAPINGLESVGFESVYYSRSNFMYDYTFYAGVTTDGKIIACDIKENNDKNADATVAFTADKPDGEIQNIWVNSDRIVVKTDKGCYYAKYNEDSALKPLDTLNALSEDVVYLCNDVVLLSNGYLYEIKEFKD